MADCDELAATGEESFRPLVMIYFAGVASGLPFSM